MSPGIYFWQRLAPHWSNSSFLLPFGAYCISSFTTVAMPATSNNPRFSIRRDQVGLAIYDLSKERTSYQSKIPRDLATMLSYWQWLPLGADPYYSLKSPALPLMVAINYSFSYCHSFYCAFVCIASLCSFCWIGLLPYCMVFSFFRLEYSNAWVCLHSPCLAYQFGQASQCRRLKTSGLVVPLPIPQRKLLLPRQIYWSNVRLTELQRCTICNRTSSPSPKQHDWIYLPLMSLPISHVTSKHLYIDRVPRSKNDDKRGTHLLWGCILYLLCLRRTVR